MCFNEPVSLGTFLLGLLFSIILMLYGNPKYKKENIVFGIMFIFISIVQLMEYFLWIDINNKYGINYLITLISPLIVIIQPFILYVIKFIYFNPELLTTTNLPLFIVNIVYFGIFLINYITNFINKKLITKVENGHLNWPIKYLMGPTFYLILLLINMFYLTDMKYSFIVAFFTYLFSILSYNYFGYHIIEMWCFFSAFLPLIIFFITRYLL